jgi:hypothetical protein
MTDYNRIADFARGIAELEASRPDFNNAWAIEVVALLPDGKRGASIELPEFLDSVMPAIERRIKELRAGLRAFGVEIAEPAAADQEPAVLSCPSWMRQ